MNELFKTVLSLSLSGSALILLLFCLDPLVGDRIGRRWQYYLWLVVVARLLLPFSPAESPVGSLFSGAEPPAPGGPALSAPAGQTPALPGGDALPGDPVPLPPREEEPAGPLSRLWVVWLGGAAALLLRKATVYQDFVRYVKAGREEVSDPAKLDLLARTGEELKVSRPVELWTHSLISSPLLLGVARPAVVLPAGDLSPGDLRCILAHELVHLKRKDLLYKWLVQLALCVHWFNPLVWLMARETDRLCELACDEGVMEHLTGEERTAYGDALLRAAGQGGGYREGVAAVTLTESGKRLKERLGAILSFRGATRGTAALAACLAAALTLGACAAGAYRAAPKAQSPGEAVLPAPSSGPPAPESPSAAPSPEEEPPANEAERLYREGDLPGFAAAFPLLGEEEKGKALERCYDDRNMACFSAAVNQLERDSSLVEQLAERSYQDGRTNFFAVLTWQMGDEALEGWLDRAKEDGSVSFQMTLLGVLGREEEMEGLRAELERERLEELRAWGITLEDGRYFYKGKPVRQLSEVDPWRFDVAVVEVDPRGEVYLTVERARDGSIESVREIPAKVGDHYLGDEEKLEKYKESLSQGRLEEYRKWGITVNGKEYRYRDRPVRIFLDLEGDSSFYTLEKDPLGEVDIKVIRSGSGKILTVSEMSEAEAAELLADWSEPDDGEEEKDNSLELPGADWRTHIVPVELETLAPGEYAWLGTFTLREGDRVSYQVAAKTGDRLTVGFARAGDTAPEVTFYTASNTDLRVDSGFMVWQSPAEPGEYQMFIRAGEQPLGGITGKVIVANILESES